MQAALVKLGDKPDSFLGSRQWIGAIELSYLLDTLLGISSKIMFVDRCVQRPPGALVSAELSLLLSRWHASYPVMCPMRYIDRRMRRILPVCKHCTAHIGT